MTLVSTLSSNQWIPTVSIHILNILYTNPEWINIQMIINPSFYTVSSHVCKCQGFRAFKTFRRNCRCLRTIPKSPQFAWRKGLAVHGFPTNAIKIDSVRAPHPWIFHGETEVIQLAIEGRAQFALGKRVWVRYVGLVWKKYTVYEKYAMKNLLNFFGSKKKFQCYCTYFYMSLKHWCSQTHPLKGPFEKLGWNTPCYPSSGVLR